MDPTICIDMGNFLRDAVELILSHSSHLASKEKLKGANTPLLSNFLIMLMLRAYPVIWHLRLRRNMDTLVTVLWKRHTDQTA